MPQIPRMGAHVDATDPITVAQAHGFDIVQISLGDPRSWKGPRVDYPGGANALRTAAEAAGVEIVVHAPFVINVASTNNRVRIPSRKALQQHVNAAAEIGAIGVVVHGGHVSEGDDREVGYDNWRKALEGLDLAAPVFIENTAGGANAMARTLDQLTQLFATVRATGLEDVGFCLDTCHAHAAGLELSGLTDVLMDAVGRIDLVHLNDSKGEFGSGVDRHASLGQGTCDPDGLVEVAASARAPIVLETPGDAIAHTQDLKWFRQRAEWPNLGM